MVKITRRTFLITGGVLLGGATLYSISRLFKYKLNFDFLEACDLLPLEYPKIALEEPQEKPFISLDEYNTLIRTQLSEEEIKRIIKVNKYNFQFLFVPELREKIASSFKDYVGFVNEFVSDEIGREALNIEIEVAESKPILVPGKKKVVITHRIGENHSLELLVEKNGASLERVEGFRWSSAIGTSAITVRAFNEKEGYKVERNSLILLADYEKSKFAILETPISELLHIFLGGATDQAILKKLRKTGSKDIKVNIRAAYDFVYIEEGLVHAIGEEFAKRIIEEYDAPVKKDDVDKAVKEYDKQFLYRYIDAWRKFIREHGIKRTVDDYFSDFDGLTRKVIN